MIKHKLPLDLIFMLSFFGLLTLGGLLVWLTPIENGITCSGSVGYSKDAYYYRANEYEMFMGADWDCVKRSHAQDAIDTENQAKQQAINAKAAEEAGAARLQCYNQGKDYNYSLDIIKDYNLSCERLAYINDHLIDSTRQVDGGYISGHYSGFLSTGSVEGHFYQYVTEGVLATGQLVKNISYHLNCDNTTTLPNLRNKCDDGWDYGWNCRAIYPDTKIVNYYSESDFVMYYVERCLQ